jgi:hypothetical protein
LSLSNGSLSNPSKWRVDSSVEVFAPRSIGSSSQSAPAQRTASP